MPTSEPILPTEKAWSLEISTQRGFNNLIKQNQKQDSDSVKKQSTTVSIVQSPAFRI